MIQRVLGALQAGTWSGDESALVDLKEEGGRRDQRGTLLPGPAQNEVAAEQVATEAACMVTTPGGGALLLGAADDGTLIGTSSDVDWLRHRVYEITDRALTIDVHEVEINAVRLLVLRAPQAIEPIKVRGRLRWRRGSAIPTPWTPPPAAAISS